MDTAIESHAQALSDSLGRRTSAGPGERRTPTHVARLLCVHRSHIQLARYGRGAAGGDGGVLEEARHPVRREKIEVFPGRATARRRQMRVSRRPVLGTFGRRPLGAEEHLKRTPSVYPAASPSKLAL